MRRVGACLVLLAAGAVGGTAVRQVSLVRAALGGRPMSAAALPVDGSAAGWVFVREGCVHCRRHLAALQRALGVLPRAQQERALRRLRVVGGAEPRIPGAVAYPDSLRRAFGVLATPSTWLLEADGRVREFWPGARNEGAWQRALQFLADAEVVP